MATTRGPLKTTAFMVSLAITFLGAIRFLVVSWVRKCEEAEMESEEACHVAWCCWTNKYEVMVDSRSTPHLVPDLGTILPRDLGLGRGAMQTSTERSTLNY